MTGHTDAVPTARHRNGLASFERIARSPCSEVRPGLHYGGMAFRVSQGERIVERWWFGEVKGACCCVVASTSVEKALHIFSLEIWASAVLRRNKGMFR